MPVSVKIELFNKKIDMSAFSKPQIEKASYRAINHALAQAKTLSIREITEIYNITAKDVRPNLFVLKAGSNLTGKILATPYTTNLAQFSAVEVREGVKTQRVGSRKSGGWTSSKTKDTVVGVRVEIIRGQKITLRNAFLEFKGSTPTVRAFGSYNGSKFDWSDTQEGKKSRLKTFSIFGAMKNEKVVKYLVEKTGVFYANAYLSQLQNLNK